MPNLAEQARRRTHKQAYERERMLRLRNEILDLLGGICLHCGYTDRRALDIDHVHGGGRAHRGNRSSVAFYRAVLRDLRLGSQDYQCLCKNCNWIKYLEGPPNVAATL